MYKMIAFDFDGTVMDSADIFIQAFHESLSPYVDHELTIEEITDTFGVSEPGTVKAIVKDNWQQALEDFHRKYEEKQELITEPIDGIVGLIAWLKEQGVRVAMITGKGEETCQISLKKVGMEQAFPDVLCGVETGPNKDLCMNALMEKYGLLQEEFAYVGDSVKDVAASHKAGVTCLSAAWVESADVEALEKVNPGLVFRQVEDLKEYLAESI